MIFIVSVYVFIFLNVFFGGYKGRLSLKNFTYSIFITTAILVLLGGFIGCMHFIAPGGSTSYEREYYQYIKEQFLR